MPYVQVFISQKDDEVLKEWLEFAKTKNNRMTKSDLTNQAMSDLAMRLREDMRVAKQGGDNGGKSD